MRLTRGGEEGGKGQGSLGTETAHSSAVAVCLVACHCFMQHNTTHYTKPSPIDNQSWCAPSYRYRSCMLGNAFSGQFVRTSSHRMDCNRQGQERGGRKPQPVGERRRARPGEGNPGRSREWKGFCRASQVVHGLRGNRGRAGPSGVSESHHHVFIQA